MIFTSLKHKQLLSNEFLTKQRVAKLNTYSFWKAEQQRVLIVCIQRKGNSKFSSLATITEKRIVNAESKFNPSDLTYEECSKLWLDWKRFYWPATASETQNLIAANLISRFSPSFKVNAMFAWIYSINLNDKNLVLSKSFKFCCQRIVIAKIKNAWQFLLTKLFLFHSPKTLKMALNKLSCLLQIFASGSQLIVKRPFDTVQQKTNKENS